MKKFLTTMAVACAVISATPAMAVTHIFNLTGTLSNGVSGSFSIGPSVYQTFNLVLDGYTPTTFSIGDEVDFSIDLDGSLTVLATLEQFIGLNFFTDGFDPINAANAGSMTFMNSGALVATQTAGCGNCLSLITGNSNTPDFTFDNVFGTFTVTSLDAPFLAENASLSYQLRDVAGVVPEPGTWAMMIIGFGMIGGMMRRSAQRLARV